MPSPKSSRKGPVGRIVTSPSYFRGIGRSPLDVLSHRNNTAGNGSPPNLPETRGFCPPSPRSEPFTDSIPFEVWD